jgi:DNA-binding transcriptional ArsR family regulator
LSAGAISGRPDVPEAVASEHAAMTEHPLSDDLIELIARRFRVLAEPTRIKLLDLLREREASVQELIEAIGSSEQNVSKHLGVLRQAGIVRRSKRGNFSYYSIADAGVFALCEHVCGGLAAELESLGEALGAVR